MKNRQRIISTMLILITLLVYLPTSAFAKISYKNLTFNKWFSINEYIAKNTIFKLKLTSDSVITIDHKRKDNEYWFDIFNDKECDDDIDVWGSKIVLIKGTYYLKARLAGGTLGKSTNNTVRFTKKSVKSINKSNTSPEKAITLKPNKEIELAFTKNDTKARWYKIQLTKAKKIFLFPNGTFDFKLYDNKAKLIESTIYWTANEEGIKGRTVKKYKKGTYYITIEDSLPFSEEGGRYLKVYWR